MCFFTFFVEGCACGVVSYVHYKLEVYIDDFRRFILKVLLTWTIGLVVRGKCMFCFLPHIGEGNLPFFRRWTSSLKSPTCPNDEKMQHCVCLMLMKKDSQTGWIYVKGGKCQELWAYFVSAALIFDHRHPQLPKKPTVMLCEALEELIYFWTLH